jgi:hypothetical protein
MMAPMPVAGRLDVALKFNHLPSDVSVDKTGRRAFVVDCGEGKLVRVTMRPKYWLKLEQAAASWPQWSALLSGSLQLDAQGLLRPEASAQVFEKKPKPPTGETPADPSPPAG